MEELTAKQRIKRLEQAYRIIDGIPNKVISMESWLSKYKENLCKTQACAFGWLSLHPTFLSKSGVSAAIVKPQMEEPYSYMEWMLPCGTVTQDGFEAATVVFSIGYYDAANLFTGIAEGNQKKIFLKNLKRFIEERRSEVKEGIEFVEGNARRIYHYS